MAVRHPDGFVRGAPPREPEDGLHGPKSGHYRWLGWLVQSPPLAEQIIRSCQRLYVRYALQSGRRWPRRPEDNDGARGQPCRLMCLGRLCHRTFDTLEGFAAHLYSCSWNEWSQDVRAGSGGDEDPDMRLMGCQ